MPYFGSVVLGSDEILTSVANAEILNRPVRNFELVNDQPCTISINGSDPIHLRALQGVAFDIAYSVKIQENGITFNWIGLMQ